MARFLLMLLLIAACGGLGWELSRQWQAPLPEQPPAARGNLEEVTALPPPPEFNMPPASEFSAIIERPLFASNRRPSAEQADQPESSKELEITFNGVNISAGERQALFQRKDGEGNLRLQEGDEFQGWILEAIEPERVIFRQGEEKKVLVLAFDEAPQQPARRRKRRTRLLDETTPEQTKKNDAAEESQPKD